MPVTFTKATKEQAKLRMALVGPAGSGKTMTALLIAKELGSKIAVIDTEYGSASLYSDKADFDVLQLTSFSVENYLAGIDAAVKGGYDVLIIDSLSHAWAGKNGVLEFKDAVSAKSGDSYGAWRKATPLHNSLVDALLAAPIHIIATMRAKTEYVIEKDDNGKTRMRKIGLQPVQRDGLEYEFGIVADLDWDHNLIIDKSRCEALTDKVFNRAGKDIADILKDWLTSGAPATQRPMPATKEQKEQVFALTKARGYSTDETKEIVMNTLGTVKPSDQWTTDDVSKLIDAINAKA